MGSKTGQTKGKRRIRWIGATIVVVGSVAGGVILALRQDAGEKPAALVVAVADRGAVTVDVATTGTVEPATTRSLSFAVSGAVESVTVRAGDKVTKGQTLATLDDTDAAGDVSDAEARLAEAKQRLGVAATAAAETTANATACARPGGGVTAAGGAMGDAAGGAMGHAAGGAMADAAGGAMADAAGGAMGDVAGRAGGDPAAGAPDDAAAGALEDAAAGRLGGAAAGPDGAAGGALTAEGDTAAAACATRGYPDTGSDQVLDAEQQVYRAARAVEEAEEALDGATIAAPIAGTVVAVAGGVGDQARSGATFISLADTYTMQIRAEFPEADAGSLAVGQSAEIALADSDVVLAARVVQVDPAGTSDGTLVRYGVVVAFADSPDDLLVGQSARVKVRTGEVADVVRIPSTAVHDVSGGAGTVLVRSGNERIQRTVAVGLRGDQYTEITSGLSEGDQVVRSW